MTLTPTAAILLLTAGILLLYWEINRPGLIVPGAVGLLASLVALGSLIRQGNSIATVLLITAVSLLLVDLLRPTHISVALAATLALTLGLFAISPTPVAVLCGILLGLGTSVLTRIARRARANKRVN
jgi:membrane-bound serine protease (ClpP class)